MGMKNKPLDIISLIIEAMIGCFIIAVFLIIYFFSDFSNVSIEVLWVFRILYLGVFPGIGLFLILKAFVKWIRMNIYQGNSNMEDDEK